MSWSPPAAWTETEQQLKQSNQIVLDVNGLGVLHFAPTSARMRWVISSVSVKTDQEANATVVPLARLALNTDTLSTMSDGNDMGASWSGNQDVFSGEWDVGPCDYMAVLFYPPPGSSPAQIAMLAGVNAKAVVTGSSFVRRA
jgi:hypothetical protein